MWNSNRGIRWQQWPDRAMQEQAEMLALEDRPDLSFDEVWKRHDGSVEVVFGSTPANVMFGAVCSEVRSLFLHGFCGLFAFAAAEELGLDQFVLVTSVSATEEDWKGHVGVLLPDGQVLDITGVNQVATFGDKVCREVATREVITVDRFRDVLFAGEHRDDPLGFLEPLEQFLLASWVATVVKDVPVATV